MGIEKEKWKKKLLVYCWNKRKTPKEELYNFFIEKSRWGQSKRKKETL